MSYIFILKSFTAISPSIFFPEVISSTLVLRKQRNTLHLGSAKRGITLKVFCINKGKQLEFAPCSGIYSRS